MTPIAVVKSKTTKFYDNDCENWSEGEYGYVTYIEVHYEGPREDFKLSDFATWERVFCPACDDYYGDDDHPLYQIYPGDDTYECAECDNLYPERYMAEQCCL